jgi:hypothetical protein
LKPHVIKSCAVANEKTETKRMVSRTDDILIVVDS